MSNTVFKNFWRGVRREKRLQFAQRVGCSVGFLNNLASGRATCSVKMALQIVDAADGALTLPDVCPDFDWAAALHHLSSSPPPS